jgi:hypothetical protein
MPTNYYWVTGIDRNGVRTTNGPYMGEDEAENATDHLSHTKVHMLPTRQHEKARRMLRDRMQGGGRERDDDHDDGGVAMHSDEPIANRSSLIQRFRDMITPPRKDDAEGDD